MRRLLLLLATAIIVALLFPECAKVVSPTGGDKDTLAPVLVHSNPIVNATNFKGNKLTFTFNEYYKLKDHQKKLLVSPPLFMQPTISQKGKKLVVEISDTLKINTTYTLYLGNAIEDINEGNPIPNFEFAFSTGPTIDSLQIKGKVVDAFTDEPIEGALVMLYDTFSDSIPYKQRPTHVAKTKKDGAFSANNLKSTDYKVVVINDINNDYLYSQGAESIGFLKEKYITKDLSYASDTSTNKKKSIRLRMFMENLPSQIITGYERPQKNAFSIYFSRPPIGRIDIKPINFKSSTSWYISESYPDKDSIRYWILDTKVAAIDTLKVAVHYQKTDLRNILRPAIDTLKMVYSTSEENKEKDKGDGGSDNFFGRITGLKRDKAMGASAKKPINPMHLSLTGSNEAKSGVPATFILPFPAKKVNPKGITLYNETDSIMEPQVDIIPDKQCPIKYTITRSWKAGAKYTLTVLPSTFITYDGRAIDTLTSQFRGADPENFGTINIKLSKFSKGIVVELLTDKNKLVERQSTPKNATVSFKYVKPGKYKIRIIDDTNGNGKWDPGNYLKNTQPENTYKYLSPKKVEELNIRANWETDIEFQKPTK